MAMIASGNAPDVIRISGVQELPTYVTRGLALNLDPYFMNSKLIKQDDLLPVANIFKYNDHGMACRKTGARPNVVY